MELTDDLVRCFAENMVIMFQVRMQSICTNELYNSTHRKGCVFLREVKDVVQRFGVDVSQVINVPITPTEAVARTQKVQS